MVQLGGQAVIEGVMIKSPNHIVVSVRHGKGIITKSNRFRSLSQKHKLLGLPFVRGVIIFGEMLKTGIEALNYSAEKAGQGEKISKNELFFATIFAVALAVGIFVLLPYGLTYITGIPEKDEPFLFNLVDGFIKLAVFILYIAAIGHMDDIKRIFQYHGAEHKAVHCHEAGLQLNQRNIRKFSPIHLRCGTSFILTVMLVGVIIFSFIPLLAMKLLPGIFSTPIYVRLPVMTLFRLAAILPIMAIAYEILKLSSKYPDSTLTQLLSLPGSLTQKLTTKEPDAKQIEVAIAAVGTAAELERKLENKSSARRASRS